MLSWNYRVLYECGPTGPLYTIIEVYYDENNEPNGFVTDADPLRWDNYDDLKGTVSLLQRAFDLPVLTIVKDEEGNEKTVEKEQQP